MKTWVFLLSVTVFSHLILNNFIICLLVNLHMVLVLWSRTRSQDLKMKLLRNSKFRHSTVPRQALCTALCLSARVQLWVLVFIKFISVSVEHKFPSTNPHIKIIVSVCVSKIGFIFRFCFRNFLLHHQLLSFSVIIWRGSGTKGEDYRSLT